MVVFIQLKNIYIEGVGFGSVQSDAEIHHRTNLIGFFNDEAMTEPITDKSEPNRALWPGSVRFAVRICFWRTPNIFGFYTFISRDFLFIFVVW